MSGVLSESEIQALVAAAEQGVDPGVVTRREQRRRKRVRSYDFRRPIKADRDQVRALDRMFTSAGRGAGVRLSSAMRSVVNVDVLRIEQGPWRELLEAFPQPATYTLVSATLQRRPLLVCMETGVLLQMLERLLGGPGSHASRRSSLSDIEMTLARRILDVIVEELDGEWRRADAEERLELRSIETEQVIANVVPATEPTIAVSMELTFGGMSAAFAVLLPYPTITRMVEQASISQYGDLGGDAAGAGDARSTAGSIAVPLRAVLLDALVPLSSIATLAVGDRIRLAPDGLERVDVRANDIPVVRGAMGRRGARRVLDVERRLGIGETDARRGAA